MAVVHCREVTGREGSRDVRSNKRYTRVFQLLSDNPTESSKAVRDHPLLPGYGDAWQRVVNGVVFEVDEDARLVDKRASQTDGDNLQNWMAYCEYIGLADPLLEPPDVDWGDATWQETQNRDAVGTPVMNAAGDFFEGGLTRDRTRFVLTINQNVLNWDPIDARTYFDTTNAVPFLAERFPPGFAVGEAKMKSIRAQHVYYNNWPNNPNVHYYRRSITVEIDRRGWNAQILNAGFNQYFKKPDPNAPGEFIFIRDVDGSLKKEKRKVGGAFASSPQLLDADGVWIKNPVPGDENYKAFLSYLPKDWSNININI